jgi:hypothetical protein
MSNIGEDVCAHILDIIESILADIFDSMENIDPDTLGIHKIVCTYYIRY